MRSAFLAIGLLLLAGSASGQRAGSLSDPTFNPLSLQPGQQIRLKGPSPDDPVVNGRVVDLYDQSYFAWVIEGGPRVIYSRAYTDVDTIDVRRRLPRQSAHSGALWGGYVGGAIGAIIGPFAVKTSPLGTAEGVLLYGATGGLIGAAAGAGMGALLAPSQWYRHIFR